MSAPLTPGIRGGPDEWLTGECISHVHAYFPKRLSLYARAVAVQNQPTDFYPGNLGQMTACVTRYYTEGERSRKMKLCFDEGKIGWWTFNLNNTHWVALFLDGRHRCGYFWDSMGGTCPLMLSTALASAEGHSGKKWNWLLNGSLGCTNGGAALQQDAFQCGIWCLQAESWALLFIDSGATSFASWLRQSVTEGRGNAAERSNFIARRRTEFRAVLEGVAPATDIEALKAALWNDGYSQADLDKIIDFIDLSGTTASSCKRPLDCCLLVNGRSY